MIEEASEYFGDGWYLSVSTVCLRYLPICVSLCVGHVVSYTKPAEPIEVPFGTWTQAGPGNHVLDGWQDPPQKGALLAVFSGGAILRHRPLHRSVRAVDILFLIH